MFNNQNKRVNTKFQNAAKSNSSQPKANTATSPNSSYKVAISSPRLNSTSPRYLETKQLANKDLKSAEGTAKKIMTKSADICTVSRLRSGAATLNRISRPFVSTCRIFRPSASKIFDYHLSPEEQNYFGHCHNAMKSVPVDELQLLRSGQRVSYLETRYERTPDDKYNYPEATSWRYGWFHRKDT